jgi:hypothetical protein
MDRDLEQGARYTLAPSAVADGSRPAPASVPAFDLGVAMGAGTSGAIDWQAAYGAWGVGYSPYTANAPATAPGNLPEFLVKLAPRSGSGDAPQFDSLGSALLGKRGRVGR